MWGSDTGGFLSTLEQLTPELLIRWIQFSAFCPVMRTKASGIEIPAHPRPQIWDEDVLPAWRTWSRWHTRLNDYLMAAHDTYRRTGRPIMCALELASPGTGAGDNPREDQYLFGPDLLVAPVLEPGSTRRRVTLPEGRWFDFFDPRGEHAHAGPAVIDIEAPLDRIPVLVRAGAVIGLLPEGVRTLSPYGPALPNHRTVLAWPDRTSADPIAGALGPAHRFASAWDGDEWTLRLEGPGETTWDIELRHRSGTRTETLEGANPTLRLRCP
jgi:alpha-glucosidase (family GH31 glycosyl hydrolase)